MATNYNRLTRIHKELDTINSFMERTSVFPSIDFNCKVTVDDQTVNLPGWIIVELFKKFKQELQVEEDRLLPGRRWWPFLRNDGFIRNKPFDLFYAIVTMVIMLSSVFGAAIKGMLVVVWILSLVQYVMIDRKEKKYD